MKKILLYILPLLLLTSCDEDNWFSHRVEYNDVAEPSQMVLTSFLVAGQNPFVYVNHSWFFLDPDRAKKLNDYYGGYYGPTNVGFLTDAEVSMIVNEKDTVHLTPPSREIYGSIAAYFAEYQLAAGDRVRITATHPDYGTATATDQVPYPITFSVDNLQQDGYNATFDLHLDAYQYTPGDVLCIRTLTRVHREYHYWDLEVLGYKDTVRFYNGKPYTTSIPIYGDTIENIFEEDMDYRYTYGQHIEFSLFEGNKAMSKGFYGVDARYSMGLCLPASAVKNGLTIPMATYINTKPQPESNNNNNHWHDYIEPDFITRRDTTIIRPKYIDLEVCVLSEQETMCRIADNKRREVDYYYVMPYPQEESVTNDAENIVESIQELFETMGNMEGVQVFDNVDGGIGHVTASSYQWIHLTL